MIKIQYLNSVGLDLKRFPFLAESNLIWLVLFKFLGMFLSDIINDVVS